MLPRHNCSVLYSFYPTAFALGPWLRTGLHRNKHVTLIPGSCLSCRWFFSILHFLCNTQDGSMWGKKRLFDFFVIFWWVFGILVGLSVFVGRRPLTSDDGRRQTAGRQVPGKIYWCEMGDDDSGSSLRTKWSALSHRWCGMWCTLWCCVLQAVACCKLLRVASCNYEYNNYEYNNYQVNLITLWYCQKHQKYLKHGLQFKWQQ